MGYPVSNALNTSSAATYRIRKQQIVNLQRAAQGLLKASVLDPRLLLD